MFALVNKEDNSITKILSGDKGITIGENQYPKTIFTLWSEAERNAIDIYTIEIDESKLKDQEWYINTDITYSFDGSKVQVLTVTQLQEHMQILNGHNQK